MTITKALTSNPEYLTLALNWLSPDNIDVHFIILYSGINVIIMITVS